MKKSFFYLLFFFIACIILISSIILFFYFENTKLSIHNIIFHRTLNEISSISNNLKKDILNLLPPEKDWYLFLKTHPKIREKIQHDFSMLSTSNIKYLYFLGVEKNKYIFLADGSKTDRAEFGEIFEPLKKDEFKILKPHYFFHKRVKGVFLTYINPIIVNNQLKGFIVIDVPYKFLRFINSLLNELTKHFLVIGFFSLVFFIVVIFFSIFDYKREKEKELLLNKLKKMNEKLEENVKKKIEEIRKKDIIILHQSKLASLGEMLTMIAHQWRQPLNSLSATAIAIEFKEEIGELDKNECIEFAKFVQSQTQRLSEIIEDFMNLSKPNKKPEEFYVKEVIDEVLKIIQVQLKNHNIEVYVDVDENLKIKSFKKELIHVLLNLISNARDALDSSKNKQKIIKIYTQEDNGYVKIIVEDNAGGVSIEIQDRIFEPYFTTKAPNKGTGLGLYMSKKIVEEILKGKLYFKNIENGARFIIKLEKEKE